MSIQRDRWERDSARFHGRVQAGRFAVSAMVFIVLLGSIALIRASGVTVRPISWLHSGAVASLSPQELAAAAADSLDGAMSAAGTGLTFEVIQRSSVNAREGG